MKFTIDPRKAFLLKFMAFIALFYGVIVIPAVDRNAVEPFTRGLAVATSAILHGIGQDVTTDGTIVRGSRAAVDIQNGCNGLEAAVILGAAVLAFPAPWRSRSIALAIGLVGIQLLNLVRTSSLYLFLKYEPRWFDALHTGVWQSILVIAALGYFFVWSSRQQIGSGEERAS